ncbi:MAG: hypothetical protein AB7V26_05495 [Lysobacterales bacterium]
MLAVDGDLNDPGSYVNEHRLKRSSGANFSVRLEEICTVEYKPRKKWGMGYYPHDGRVLIGTAERTRELIILGNQSGQEISARLTAVVGRPNWIARRDD